MDSDDGNISTGRNIAEFFLVANIAHYGKSASENSRIKWDLWSALFTGSQSAWYFLCFEHFSALQIFAREVCGSFGSIFLSRILFAF